MLYENGGEVRLLNFTASVMTNTGWFSQKNLISAPWADLKNKNPLQHFDISGSADRSFEITNNYGGCEYDAGWLVITGNACPWEERRPLPSILYSKKAHLVKYDDDGKHIQIISLGPCFFKLGKEKKDNRSQNYKI